MKPVRIDDLQKVESLLAQYRRPGTLTNNYLLAREYEDLACSGKLFCCERGDNCFFLVEKPNCFRIYYLLNDTSQPAHIEADMPLMLEILYRGQNCYPTVEERYWQENGLKTNLVRDFYENSYKNLAIRHENGKNCEIRMAETLEDCVFAMKLFNSVFDPFSGDYVTLDMAEKFLRDRQLLIATANGERAGALNFFKNANKYWLGHVAVKEACRGLGIGKGLVNEYILRNRENDNTRYCMWVQSRNTRAVEMYRNLGFKYSNKSTLSMITV